MMQYDAVIFDMDGVIFDSEKCVLNCWIKIAEKYGIENMEAGTLSFPTLIKDSIVPSAR